MEALAPGGAHDGVFGAERLVFGSNFPMDKSIADGATRQFRDDARRVYRI